ncbi:unnamed protein product [Heterobilharzia americana]|nr:unnamed protein product [Heterobilharzia americana]
MWLIYVLITTSYAIPLDFPCYDETWLYLNVTGKCYKSILGVEKLTFSSAALLCKTYLQNVSQVPVNLLQFYDENEADSVVDMLFRNGYKETIWLGANRSEAKQPFTWYTDGSTADFKYIEWSEGTKSGNCIDFSYSTEPVIGTDKWSVTKMVDNKPCEIGRSFICEHKVPLCQDLQGGFNSTTMVLKPPVISPGSIVQAVCGPGTVKDSSTSANRLSGFNVDLSLSEGFYRCTGTRFNNSQVPEDPLKFKPRLLYSGYTLTPCSSVRCNQTQLENMIPKYAKLVSAHNRITEQVFGSHQVNQFCSYGNVISIRCNPGYLFNDRTAEKSVSCELVSGSETVGEYRGYSGTLLPLPQACEEATCLYEEAVIQPDSHMEPYFIVIRSNLNVVNLTKHAGVPYPRGTVIRYFCKNGYESINQNSELNITCGDYGRWTPQLIGCIARIEKVSVSDTGRFYSEPEEAESALKLSSIMFIMVFIFLGIILLLDLATIGRDFKQIKSNIKLQKRRIDHSKNKSKMG